MATLNLAVDYCAHLTIGYLLPLIIWHPSEQRAHKLSLTSGQPQVVDRTVHTNTQNK